MNRRITVAAAVLTAVWAVGSAACAPYLPSTVVPAVQSPALEAFRTALKTYIDQTQRFRKAAALTGDAARDQTSADGSEAAVRLRQRSLAEAIQTKVRPAAQQGDVLSPAVADLIRKELARAFAGSKADVIRDGLEDQNEGLAAGSIDVTVNQIVALPRVPPVLLETLPQLPQQVEFAFSGRTLILRDVDADVVVDFIRRAFPDPPLAGRVPPPSQAAVSVGSDSLFRFRRLRARRPSR